VINKPTGPHNHRHAFITAALDARHPTYIVAALLAGAAR
jgi:hypothetical protein